MSFVVLPDGSIRVETAEAAIALSQRLASSKGGKPLPVSQVPATVPVAAPPASSPKTLAPHGFVPMSAANYQINVDASVKFLSAISVAASRGLGLRLSEMLALFPGTKPKGLAAKTGAVNHVLHRLGFNKDEVYKADKTMGGRVYKAGPKLEQALEACHKEVQLF